MEQVLTTTLEQTPPGATHWSTRRLAAHLGLSQSAVSRSWRAFGLQPHRCETFKLSRDPFFIEKVRDIVGLYLNPPDRALVLCVDEKPQIQATEGTAPGLPLVSFAFLQHLRLRAAHEAHARRPAPAGRGREKNLPGTPALRERTERPVRAAWPAAVPLTPRGPACPHCQALLGADALPPLPTPHPHLTPPNYGKNIHK